MEPGCSRAPRCLQDGSAGHTDEHQTLPLSHTSPAWGHGPSLPRIRLIYSAPAVPGGYVGQDKLGANNQPCSDRSPTEDKYWTRPAPVGVTSCAASSLGCTGHPSCPKERCHRCPLTCLQGKAIPGHAGCTAARHGTGLTLPPSLSTF